MEKRERLLWLDVVRVLAIVSISLNHAINRTYDNSVNTLYEFHTLSTPSLLFKTAISVFSRLGVPLFLMITGALLLGRKMDSEEAVKKFYKHNFLRLLITCIIWNFIAFWFFVLLQPNNTVLAEHGLTNTCIKSIYSTLFINQIRFGSMWYTPVILCIYLMIPILSIAINSVSPKAFLPTFGALLLLGFFIPNINGFFEISQINMNYDISLNLSSLCSSYLLYLLIGYYIKEHGLFNKLPTWMIALISLALFTFDCGYQYWAYGGPTNYLVSYNFLGIIACAAFIFEFIKRVANKLVMIKKPIAYISKISFGIYFVHIAIIELLNWHWNFSNYNRFEKCMFLEITSLLGSIIIIAILSKIKLFKDYLFMIKD